MFKKLKSYNGKSYKITNPLIVTIKVADEAYAGTDSNIYIKFGNTEYLLDTPANDFERNTVNVFTINGIDETVFRGPFSLLIKPAFLGIYDALKVQNIKLTYGNSTRYFEVNAWLDRSKQIINFAAMPIITTLAPTTTRAPKPFAVGDCVNVLSMTGQFETTGKIYRVLPFQDTIFYEIITSKGELITRDILNIVYSSDKTSCLPYTTTPAPINCQVSEWSPYSACSAICGGGTQTRNRTILTPASNDGSSCPYLSETQSCNSKLCIPIFTQYNNDGTFLKNINCEMNFASSSCSTVGILKKYPNNSTTKLGVVNTANGSIYLCDSLKYQNISNNNKNIIDCIDIGVVEINEKTLNCILYRTDDRIIYYSYDMSCLKKPIYTDSNGTKYYDDGAQDIKRLSPIPFKVIWYTDYQISGYKDAAETYGNQRVTSLRISDRYYNNEDEKIIGENIICGYDNYKYKSIQQDIIDGKIDLNNIRTIKINNYAFLIKKYAGLYTSDEYQYGPVTDWCPNAFETPCTQDSLQTCGKFKNSYHLFILEINPSNNCP